MLFTRLMKNRKLLIPVRYTTRKFYLQPPPPGRNDWHVRFVPPSVDGASREIFRSTGTKEIPAARRIAAQIIESFWTDAGRVGVKAAFTKMSPNGRKEKPVGKVRNAPFVAYSVAALWYPGSLVAESSDFESLPRRRNVDRCDLIEASI
jgi:hypothetical protein